MGGSDTSLNSFKREKEENYRRNESQKNYKILKKKKKPCATMQVIRFLHDIFNRVEFSPPLGKNAEFGFSFWDETVRETLENLLAAATGSCSFRFPIMFACFIPFFVLLLFWFSAPPFFASRRG